jgi:hypothetical protein
MSDNLPELTQKRKEKDSKTLLKPKDSKRLKKKPNFERLEKELKRCESLIKAIF